MNYDTDYEGEYKSAKKSYETYMWECEHEHDEIDGDVRSTVKRYDLDRYRALMSMHNLVVCMNDEDAYSRWIYIVPDEASCDDLMSIACDKAMFKDCVKLFRKLWAKYVSEDVDGLYIGDECY